MKIAIVTMAIGKYHKFLLPLYQSINEFMFTEHEVHFLGVMSESISEMSVKIVDELPAPLHNLLKYHYINTINMSEFDLIYYVDGDCKVVSAIGNEVIPDNSSQIVAVEHPWQGCNSNIYETNPLSLSAVRDNKGMHYFQSCFFGGYRDVFVTMCQELDKNIKADLKNCIIAKWYDESHFNRYCIDHPPKQLHMGYAYPDPELWHQTFSFEPKILHYNYGSIIK